MKYLKFLAREVFIALVFLALIGGFSLWLQPTVLNHTYYATGS